MYSLVKKKTTSLNSTPPFIITFPVMQQFIFDISFIFLTHIPKPCRTLLTNFLVYQKHPPNYISVVPNPLKKKKAVPLIL